MLRAEPSQPRKSTATGANIMTTRTRTAVSAAAAVLILAATRTAFQVFAQQGVQRDGLDAEAIGNAAGTKAMLMPDGVVGIRWARDEVPVTVDRMAVKPFAGLGSVAAFHRSREGAMVMGDIVVFQDEVSAAMDAAFTHGFEVTALHNHFAFDQPKVSFMHIGGSGDSLKLASGVKAVRDAITQVRKTNPEPAESFHGTAADTTGSIDAAQIEQILGRRGRSQGGVMMVSIGREGRMHGVPIGESMGLGTTIAFSGSDDNAAVYGDFIMTAREVQPVLRTLRQHAIHIVALHNHMIGEEPAFYFAHFWGKGPAKSLAAGMRAALEAQRRTDTRR